VGRHAERRDDQEKTENVIMTTGKLLCKAFGRPHPKTPCGVDVVGRAVGDKETSAVGRTYGIGRAERMMTVDDPGCTL
jgi:hypothetical protein